MTIAWSIPSIRTTVIGQRRAPKGKTCSVTDSAGGMRTEEEKLPFTQARPGKCKGMGRRVKLRPDWEQVKVGLMEEIVRAKFTQNEELKRLLLATGDKRLAEGNTWGDTFWGVDLRTGQGENHLGRILMKVRGELVRG